MQLMDPKTIALAFVVTGAVSLYINAAELEKVVMQALSHSVAAQRFATLYYQGKSHFQLISVGFFGTAFLGSLQ